MTRLQPGAPHPLGATWDGRGVNFALFSAHATRVELCLFDPSGRRETERIDLPEYTDEVWHGRLADVRPGLVYGYRVHGPWDPSAGHRFNPHKLLVDPYARQLLGEVRWHDALYGHRVGSPRADLAFDRRDSAAIMPKCVVVDPSHGWGRHARPARPWTETIIYEAHVKGLTQQHPDVPEAFRGTFAGLCHPAVIEHLVRLGVTAVELLPIHASVDDRFLTEKGLRNYWGYQTLGFFAPHGRTLASGHLGEVKTAVSLLHDAGIEVILDVVYNHTAEGSHLGPTLSFRGIDNATYYRLDPDDPRHYLDVTGCGNTLNLGHPRVLQMVMDSLRLWATEFQVDGFRFDLASALAREADGFDHGSGFFDAIRQDPALAEVKLIAEPWDLGPSGYRVGGFPPGWSEWNDRFRDTVRSYWRGDEGRLPELASRLTGSSDHFNHHGRRPWASVNFVTAHDGFTLEDLVSFNEPHNQANQEASGHGDNRSWNCGVEGPTRDPAVRALRLRQKKNMLATLLLSQGVPMLLAGDEHGRTQRGNNNAYCQDNAITWHDWAGIGPDGRELTEFVALLTRIRREVPAFRRPRFFTGRRIPDMPWKDITWLAPHGGEKRPEDWATPFARCFGLHFGAWPGEPGPHLLLMNAHWERLDFTLPGPALGEAWWPILDTEPGPTARAAVPAGAVYPLAGRALVLLEAIAGDALPGA